MVSFQVVGLGAQPAAGDRVPSGSPPPQAADSGHGKRGRSADAEGEQGSEPRAKKTKPAGDLALHLLS